jgi:hypothetical protein
VSDLIPFIDIHGEERRCGLLPPPDGLVSAFPDVESDPEMRVLDDADIRRIAQAWADDPKLGEWRILDQKSHGSCAGFGCAGATMTLRHRMGIRDQLKLSGAWLYSWGNSNSDSGAPLEWILRAAIEHGIPPESIVPWNIIYQRDMPANAAAEAAKRKPLKWRRVTTKQQYRSCLAQNFPVVVALHAGSRFQRPDANGISGVDNGGGNHCVYTDAIRMINGTECYRVVNSWNTRFGNKGTTWVTWASFEQCFGRHQFYTCTALEEEGI